MPRFTTYASALLAILLVTNPGSALVAHNEATDGDLSGSFGSPTVLTLTPEVTNTISGQVGENGNTGATDNSDADYFQFTLSPGQSVTAFAVAAYTPSATTGSGSFIGYSDAPFGGQASNNIDAFVLFNAGSGNLLSNLTTTGSLGAGTHYFWVQETATATVDYEFSLTVVPEPTTAAGLAGIVLLVWGTRSSAHRRGTDR